MNSDNIWFILENTEGGETKGDWITARIEGNRCFSMKRKFGWQTKNKYLSKPGR